jgi:phage/plasmid-like protein (TIGR03299 family)
MAHELEMVNGQANMVWADTPCWHGLGTQMDPKDGALAWMKAANLDWKVERRPMETTLPNGQRHVVQGKNNDDYGVLVRDHGTGKFAPEDVFGPIGPEWEPVQNQQVFEFMEKFCKAGKMKMETCGALKGGTELWALAKYNEFEFAKGDTAIGYILFHSAHIWGKSNQIRNTATRVVCNNTLAAALGEGKNNAFRMPHVRAFDAEVQQAAETAIVVAHEQNKRLQEKAQFLSKKKAKPEQVQEFIARVFQPKLIAERKATNDTTPIMDRFTPSSQNTWDAITFAPGAELQSAKGTWWGAYNGVTYHEDHMRFFHNDETNVIGSALIGAGARRKEQALEMALEYAEAA